jgi:sec-independent protein translocase protein TatB
MFGMGMPEILLILAIALIVLGPKKLPEIAKSLGRGIAEFKKATSDFKQSMEVDNDFKEAKETLHSIKTDVEQSVRDTMAQGAATMGNDDGDDFAPEKAPQSDSEKDVEKTPQESAEDTSQEQSEEKAKQEEPSSNA